MMAPDGCGGSGGRAGPQRSGAPQGEHVNDQGHAAVAQDRGGRDARHLAIVGFEILDHDLMLADEMIHHQGEALVLRLENDGDGPGQIQIVRDEYSLNDLSFRIGVRRDKIITADNNLKRLQIIDGSSNPELIIGSIQNIDKNRNRAVNFNFNVIGAFTTDNDNNLYVQNRLISKNYSSSDQEGANFSPSYILVFNENGELQYTMGKSGTPDIPFFYIEKQMEQLVKFNP